MRAYRGREDPLLLDTPADGTARLSKENLVRRQSVERPGQTKRRNALGSWYFGYSSCSRERDVFDIQGKPRISRKLIKLIADNQDIAKGKYEVVVTNPEILVTSDELKALWKVPSFTERILGFVFDEAHCISQWGKFRKHYLAVGILRYLISEPVPFYAASATFPPPIIAETRRLLHMNSKSTAEILCSNDRPEIGLMVRELVYPSSSYNDLSFLIPYNWQNTMTKPKKFLVFFDDIKEAKAATKYFRRQLLKKFRSKIAWFHSTMSQEYRDEKVKEFREGKVWGMFCTDAFGLVSIKFAPI